MRRVFIVVSLVLTALVIFFLLTPNHEAKIRSRLAKLGETLTVTEKDDQLARIGKARTAASFFLEPFSVSLTLTKSPRAFLAKRTEVTEMVLMVLNQVKELQVGLTVTKVEIEEDAKSARADVLATAAAIKENESEALELNVDLARQDREWYIKEIRTVKNLEDAKPN